MVAPSIVLAQRVSGMSTDLSLIFASKGATGDRLGGSPTEQGSWIASLHEGPLSMGSSPRCRESCRFGEGGRNQIDPSIVEPVRGSPHDAGETMSAHPRPHDSPDLLA